MQVLEMFWQVLLAVFLALLVSGGYKVLKLPPPKRCGFSGGPPATSPRIRLTDGRYLAYRELGVSKNDARYKIIVAHGFDSSKDQLLPVSQEVVEELKLYFLFYDRPGYGESEPHPRRSVKSEAYDIQELADTLQLGSKFYVIGISMGGYTAWSCLRYIPHRLAGVSLIASFVHYWWPDFSSEVSSEAWRKLSDSERWTFRVAHFTAWLLHWWMNQKWFPSLRLLSNSTPVFSQRDLEIVQKRVKVPKEKIRQQGVYESLHQDIMVSFANWEFSPLDLGNPFLENEGSVHIWQGCEDYIIPVEVNRFISGKLEWIKYHEIPDGGHQLIYDPKLCETIIRALVFG